MENNIKKELDNLIIKGIKMQRSIVPEKSPYNIYAKDFKIVKIVKDYNKWLLAVMNWFRGNKYVAKRDGYALFFNNNIPKKGAAEALGQLKEYKDILSKESQDILAKIEGDIRSNIELLYKLGDKIPNIEDIRIIEIFKEKNDKMLVFVNKQYADPIEPRNIAKDSSLWKNFYELAQKGKCTYNSNLKKYFNSNKSNPIYTRGYTKKTVLSQSGSYLVPASGIKIKILRHKPKLN